MKDTTQPTEAPANGTKGKKVAWIAFIVVTTGAISVAAYTYKGNPVQIPSEMAASPQMSVTPIRKAAEASGQCASAERTYEQSADFFWKIYKGDRSRLDELTVDDLEAVVFMPWLGSGFVTEVKTAFSNEAEKNRSTLSPFGPTTIPNFTNENNSYTGTWASLALKSVYLELAEASMVAFRDESDGAILEKISPVRESLRKVISEFAHRNIPSGPIDTYAVAKDGKVVKTSLTVSALPDGNFTVTKTPNP